MKLLITGGAGYVGSPVVHELKKLGHEIAVFDNLVYGHKGAIPKGVRLIEGDLIRMRTIADLFEQFEPEAVLHFASYTYIGESVEKPEKYFQNNVVGSLNLLCAMRSYGVKKIIFSSSAAVYGQPKKVPITEDSPLSAESPYGESKIMIEKMLHSFDVAYGIKSVSLRYFNAAGADLNHDLGEDHNPETHLIPLVIKAALGKIAELKIFGDDYDTPDGTCIRDYIHIKDLAGAHILALDKLNTGSESGAYNLGNGTGTSVKEIIETARSVSGKKIPAKVVARRAGDPARLVASFEKAKKELSWLPKRSDVKTIINNAWEWHSRHPNGY
jgi:UDP-glucose 4-epimerase